MFSDDILGVQRAARCRGMDRTIYLFRCGLVLILSIAAIELQLSWNMTGVDGVTHKCTCDPLYVGIMSQAYEVISTPALLHNDRFKLEAS